MTAPPPPSTPASPTRLLTFRSGGWVLLLAFLISIYAAFWMLGQRRPLHGDGRNIDTYDFQLTPLLVPRHLIAASGMPKDGLPALLQPATLNATELNVRNRGYGRFLVGSDKVVGVALGGEAQVYPLALLLKHEIVNDVVGQVPVVISYSPFTDSVVVACRVVRGRTLEFGHSGLLYNSNLLLFDRQSAAREESLWSQLQGRAIAGPAAARGETLTLLPCAVVTWEAWLKEHPDTRVMAPASVFKQEYNYDLYRASDDLIYPVEPRWEEAGWKKKTPVAAVHVGGRWRVVVLPELKRDGAKVVELQEELGAEVVVTYDATAETLQVRGATGKSDPPVVYAYLFAWYAQHPETMKQIGVSASQVTPATTMRSSSH